ncbi:MAG TPA: hypothetical protein VGY55_02885 [Pirellulales bacterium]|jgi:hypothetical protein|nr:hypothetical protein [Pirellulales bacterium]
MTRNCSLRGLFSGVLAAFACLLVEARGVLRAADITDARASLEAKYAADLAELANWSDQHQLTAEAKLARAWSVKRDPRKLYIFDVPDALVAPAKMADDPNLAEWWTRWVKLRRTQADALFDLAGKTLDDHRPALAYELIRQIVREFPDHEAARTILGYEKSGGRWVSAYAAHRLALGQVFDERFGWLPAKDVPRYERGERNYRGTWLSAADDARLHSQIKSGWRIDTEHFVVTTDDGIEAGVRLARKLERLDEIWRQVFVTYYMTEGELTKRYHGVALPRHEAKQHQVVLFRNRDEYNAALKPSQPMIGVTLGYYWFDSHTAYFFSGDEQNDATIYHEATHELFQENRTAVRDLGKKSNFWVVEAVACYMESLTNHGGYWTLGGADEGRMPAALTRLLQDNFYVPLAEMTSYSRDAIQHDPRLPKLYSEASGLANFLIHFRSGRYRQPLIDYLIAVYSGRAEPDTLAKLTGASYEQLDQQYRDYMKEVASGEN